MKKQIAIFLSFSALLTIGAMAPHVLWQDNNESPRAPASIEQKETKLKELEKVEIKSEKVASVQVDAGASCLKDKQPKDLEAEVKKLMEDKEAIMKELAELKKAKDDSKVEVISENKKEDKKEDKKEKVAKSDNTEDVLGIMSQLTNLMISQQQQQMMMTQMFSMFQMQQPKQQSQGFSPLSEYMSPYAFNAGQFEFPKNESPYSLGGYGHKIGLNSDYGRSYSNFDRAPAQSDYGTMFDRSIFDSEGSFQPQPLVERPHNGFDFRQGTSAMNMSRVQF